MMFTGIVLAPEQGPGAGGPRVLPCGAFAESGPTQFDDFRSGHTVSHE